MKALITLLFIIIHVNCFSQRVVVKGRVWSKNGSVLSFPRVELNDTVSKFSKAHPKGTNDDRSQDEVYAKLIKDTNYVVQLKFDGLFSIMAKLVDTLYFKAIDHITQKHAVSDLLKLKEVNVILEPEPCEEYKPCRDTLSTRFYAFVGKKVSVTRVLQPKYCNGVIAFDQKFEAKYKVIKNVYGKLRKDTISFTAFDHYGTPAFSNYEHVLLFVSEHCGDLYHEKYQFFDVYLNSDGKWASPGDPYRLDRNIVDRNVRAEPMSFGANLSFDTKKISYPIKHPTYKAPYYTINGDKAIPVMGTLVDKLFLIKKDGVFKGRKIFK